MPFPRGMTHPNSKTGDQEAFLREFTKLGASAMAKKYGVLERSIYRRREKLERSRNMIVAAPTRGGHVQELDQHPAAINLHVRDGIVIVGSDAHFWPGIHSTAFRAFVKFCQDLNPVAVVMNGDAYDGARVSRWPDGSWQDAAHKPSVIQELTATKDALSEIEKAAPKARRIWTMGNHDSRFEMRLLQQAPEYAEVEGVKLKDHFPAWEPCWATLVNKDVVIKHRFKGGKYAPANNTMNAGRTIVTGHLHSLKVMPHSDYNGTRWGVDCGTLADPYGPQFSNYTELNPLDWRSGFAVLTFKGGELLWPETVWVRKRDEIEFRGEVIRV